MKFLWMKVTRRIFPVVVFLIGMLFPGGPDASHNMGVDLTYECLNNCTIRIHLRAYRDCSGINTIPSTLTWTLLSGSGCAFPIQVGSTSPQQTTEVTPICPSITTRCTTPGATILGVEEYYWFMDYDICTGANGCVFSIGWDDCCRNGAITSGSSGESINIHSTTLNTSLPICNSSPQFSNPPVPYVCAGQSYTFNQGATDPEGDSLSYSIGPCFLGANPGDSITYNNGAGYTNLQPLGASWDVSIDATTGDITLTPQPGNIVVGVMCVYVTEWRNGVAINTIVRDMQITVISCANTIPALPTGATNMTGGTGSGFNFTVCMGSTLCFDLVPVDPDTGQIRSIYWNGTLNGIGGTFVDAFNSSVVDSVFGANPVVHFCFNPQSVGVYHFLVTVVDDACPILGQNQYTFTIVVGGVTVSMQDSSLGCGPASLCVTPLTGIPPYTFTWTGNGGLTGNPNANDSCLIHNYPGPGTYIATVTITDSVAICPSSYSDTLVIPPLSVDAGPDHTFCSLDSAVIGIPSAVNTIYQWTPVTGLSDPTAAQPTLTLFNGGTVPVQHSYTVTATDTTTGCTNSDVTLITVNPIPASSFTLPSQVCANAPVQITYTGYNSPTANYNWNFGLGANPATSGTQGPHNVSWSSAGTKGVTLSVVEFGCTSAVSVDSIIVWPIPVAAISPVNDHCTYDATIDFVNAGTYGGVATFNWQFQQGANPVSSTDENPLNVTWTTPGVKTATLQITEHGCISNIATETFEVFPQPNALWTNVSGPQCLTNNSYNFAASGNNGAGASYAWTFGNGTPATSSVQNPAAISFSSAGNQIVTLIVTENGCTDTVAANIIVNPNPIVDAGPDVSFCQGAGGAQLMGTGTGGTPVPPGTSYYWTWWCDSTSTWCGLDSVFDDDPIANPNVSTTYYTQIVDFNGCISNIDSAFVTVIPKPVVDAGPDLWLCTDSAPCQLLQPTISNSPGPFSYQWTPALGLNNDTIPNPCARPAVTTIYTLVVTDQGTGCSSGLTTVDTNSTVTVHVNPLPVAVAGPDVEICLGDSIMLQGYGTAAGPSYDFEWSPANGVSNVNIANPMVSPAATTDFVLTVWSNNCPSIGDTVEVTVHTLPTVDAGPDVEICLGETATLDATASGDPFTTGYTYHWTPGTGIVGSADVEDLMAAPVSTTTYYVVATSDFNCGSNMDSATVYLKPTPFPDAGEPWTICSGDTIQLEGSYYYTTTDTAPDPSQIYYTWTPGAMISDPTAQDPNAWPASSMFFYLQINYNTCQTLDSVFVNVAPSPVAMVSADTTVLCEKDTVMLTASGGVGGATITWNPNGATGDTIFVSPEVTTTYIATVTEGSCTDQASVTVQVIPAPEAAYMSSVTSGCVPFEVSFLDLSTDVLQWVWNFGDGAISNDPNPSHTYVTPGEYNVSLTAINAGACQDKVNTITVTVHDTAYARFTSDPLFPVEMSLPNTTVNFDDQSLNAVTWEWMFGDGITAEGTQPEHTYTEPGVYYVTLRVTNDFGCISEVTHGPYIVVTPELLIPNVFTPNDDNVNDLFLVKYTGSQPFTINIYDRWGVLVFTEKNKHAGWDGNFNGQKAPEGVYYYTVKIADKEYTGSATLLR